MPVNPDLKKRGAKINAILAREYPEAACSLNYAEPYQLLVATILAAQCTDERVNMVTPAFFAEFPDANALAGAAASRVEELIKCTGFFRNKAKSLLGMAQTLVGDFGGKTPRTMEQLLRLRGVGRKTANVILGNCCGVPGIIVDTHCQRLSKRLGLAAAETPEKIELELMEVIPRKEWTLFSHRLVFHGRRVCRARKPCCEKCAVSALCDYFRQFQPKPHRLPATRKKARP
ncbi:MAG: endonuclease III [bacterium]|nr:endonuclease III [Candidatus Sumerlaeota bacterium]